MNRTILPKGTTLNPGEKINQQNYDFEREFALPRTEIGLSAHKGVFSLYLRFTPTHSGTPCFGVCDVFLTDIQTGDGDEPWELTYLWNPHDKAIDGTERIQPKAVADAVDHEHRLLEPAGIGDVKSGFFGNRREYQGNEGWDFGRALELPVSLELVSA